MGGFLDIVIQHGNQWKKLTFDLIFIWHSNNVMLCKI